MFIPPKDAPFIFGQHLYPVEKFYALTAKVSIHFYVQDLTIILNWAALPKFYIFVVQVTCLCRYKSWDIFNFENTYVCI